MERGPYAKSLRLTGLVAWDVSQSESSPPNRAAWGKGKRQNAKRHVGGNPLSLKLQYQTKGVTQQLVAHDSFAPNPPGRVSSLPSGGVVRLPVLPEDFAPGQRGFKVNELDLPPLWLPGSPFKPTSNLKAWDPEVSSGDPASSNGF